MHTTAFALAIPLMGAFVNAVPYADDKNCLHNIDGLEFSCGKWGEQELDFHWYPIESYKNYSSKDYAFYNSMRHQLCARMDLALNANASSPFEIKGTVNQYLDYGFNTTQAYNNQTVTMGKLPAGNGTQPIILKHGVLGRVSLTIQAYKEEAHSFKYEQCVKALEVFQKPESCCYGRDDKDTLGGTVRLPDKTLYQIKAEALPKDLAAAAATTMRVPGSTAPPSARSLQGEVKRFGLPYKW
ncbi:hypothetical protein BDV96DRAFT_339883 [Lophiotrema nucula]|uniref:Uncharacterized protein n=1 Tax=Lophiotrema nucula TaxID=690887 RepID=A0A6A5YID8_9PLEO|nr:hypothetical protein BDV96DRAFT_339883 [Lophiotrema nucula]